MIIPFVDWKPDVVDFGAQGSSVITNAVPAERSFQPFPRLTGFTNAITARPRGALEAYDKDDVAHIYVGDETSLYELSADRISWDTVTRSSGGNYATGSGEIWNFARWKNKVLATNFSDSLQQVEMGSANFSELTSSFRCRNIAVVGDFVVCSNTWDSTDGNVPNRVRWSAISDETDFTVSPTTLSDFRDLTTGGPIRKIVGGEVGIICSERSIFRMSYIGAPVVFQIDEILPDVGTICGGAVTSLGDNVYLISDQGFIEITANGTGVNYIGAGRVDQWFRSEYDSDYPDRVFSIPDPTNNRILWAFPGTDSTSGRPNKIVIYDKTFDKWALVEEEVELILRAKGFSVTLENLPSFGFTNIDEMIVSLDSTSYKTTSQLGAFTSDQKLGFFAGPAKDATIETGEFQLNQGSVTCLSSFRPLVESGSVTAQVGKRSKKTNPVAWSNDLTPRPSGRVTSRSTDNYHRIRLKISGEWDNAIGVEINREDATRIAGRARSD